MTSYEYTRWTWEAIELQRKKSSTFQEIYGIDTDEGVNDLLRWAGRPDVQAKPKNAMLTELGYGHMYTVMHMWNLRPDLRDAFPEASLAGDLRGLLTWAGNPAVLALESNAVLRHHEPVYVLLHIFFTERNDLRSHPVFTDAQDGSDPSSLYCWADYVLNGDGNAANDDPKLLPYKEFYTERCPVSWY